MAAGFSFSLSKDGASAPLLAVDSRGQASGAYGGMSFSTIASQFAAPSQGNPPTGRVTDPAVVKAAPVPSPWQWLRNRPLVLVGIAAGLLAVWWVSKRRKKG